MWATTVDPVFDAFPESPLSSAGAGQAAARRTRSLNKCILRLVRDYASSRSYEGGTVKTRAGAPEVLNPQTMQLETGKDQEKDEA